MTTSLTAPGASIQVPRLEGPALNIATAGAIGAAFGGGGMAVLGLFGAPDAQPPLPRPLTIVAKVGTAAAVGWASVELLRHVDLSEDAWVSTAQGTAIGIGIGGANAANFNSLFNGTPFGRGPVAGAATAAMAVGLLGAGIGLWSGYGD